MAEDQYQALLNGQAWQIQDANLVGQVAGLGDERALAELLRVKAYAGGVFKYILPFGDGNLGKLGTVIPSGSANGSVLINPFRAIVGPTTAEGTDAKKSWRDTRSGIYTGTATARQGTLQFGANASGNPRWDLVMASIARDANGASVTRKVKDPTTKVISSPSTIVQLVQSVSVSIVPGTPAATPVWPAATADSSTVFNIPLAYVRIPNGFTTGSTIAVTDIANIAPIAALSRTTGGVSSQPMNQLYTPGGSIMTTTVQGNWGASVANRPGNFVPSELFGAEILHFMGTTRSEPGQIAVNQVLDDRDWRGRRALCFIQASNNANISFAQTNPVTDVLESLFSTGPVYGSNFNFQFGQTIIQETSTPNKAYLCRFANGTLSQLGATNEIGVYCDLADSGKLKFHLINSPTVRFWLTVVLFGVHANGI